MAKLVHPLLSQDARGSLAGVQYSRNRSGSFGSRKSTSNRHQGDVATAHRTRIKTAHTAWTALSSQLKSHWEEFSGGRPTGRNAFIGATLTNLTIAYPPPAQSPLDPPPLGPPHSFIYWPDYFGFFFHIITWTKAAYDVRRLLVYYRQDTAPSIPHVRKMPFYNHQDVDFQIASLYPSWLPEYAALRVRVWDPLRGRCDAEWRDWIDWQVQKNLFGYEP